MVVIPDNVIGLPPGVLYTEAFERMQAARARGVCAGITRPGKRMIDGRSYLQRERLDGQLARLTDWPGSMPHESHPTPKTVSIPQLVADHGLDEAVLEDTLTQLLKTNRLRGTMRGREFVPAAFSRTQRACVDAFFAQNGYLEFARAQRLKVCWAVAVLCTFSRKCSWTLQSLSQSLQLILSSVLTFLPTNPHTPQKLRSTAPSNLSASPSRTPSTSRTAWCSPRPSLRTSRPMWRRPWAIARGWT